jgi:Fe-S-cluster-containing hydrogenase component 2
LLVVQELCTGCLECIEICPADAIDARVHDGEVPGGEGGS